MNAIAKKLQVKMGSRWLIANAPEDYISFLEPLPNGIKLTFQYNQKVDGVQLFVKNSNELETEMQQIKPLLELNIILWIIYPKKSSGVGTDLEMMGSWDKMSQHGLRPVASAAINDTWTALRFKPESEVKISTSRNSEIKTNDYAQYIDVDSKSVKLPEDVRQTLQQHPIALAYFNGLAYSHKKEYVIWILSAKQEKTRTARIEKMVEMLLNKKKNPSDK
ncbi:YdeI/OmpD-associated family protein [Mucilaginibacter sp. KACC 22063]|uniref:YdeI/OmpD-associated family protein n=1 Tax=Mucilaginibacter sp. KACC 22063 TaxID=3025666 RepID=UPI0023665FD9|nr:YdeI/OmpD-associated family protein [Mucilaginibacter sp. KACC 22063]WDF53731.1 YdeI/OmpD-associated family protein [Mucilaginibacter sp. KACC 22063]